MGSLCGSAPQAWAVPVQDRALDAPTPAIEAQPGQPAADAHGKPGARAFLGLALGSAGVVYGDIGTSPLYAFRESISHVARHGGRLAQGQVVGVISLML
ncbi:MAG: KUP/HAK/KT family potassium transporter, partial [Proteobacteria bacterium]|nr:KUP/HAK/KT family potassium transporter [Pseudomonadota bacterium]